MKNIKSGNHGLYKFQYALELKLLSNLQLNINKVQNNDLIKNIDISASKTVGYDVP